MKIILNGNPQEVANSLCLQNIIEEFCKDSRPVVAEVNGQIVKSHQWQSSLINDGDQIELVNIVAGG